MSLALAHAALLALVLPQEPEATPAARGCTVCHGEQGVQHAAGVHAKAGLGCTDCHGGVDGPLDAAEAHGSSLLALKRPREIVDSCGGCHADVQRMRHFGLRTDQLSLYATSRHGERLAQDPDAPVATCASCHGSHAILSPRDPRSPVHPFHQVQTCGKCHSDAEAMARFGLAPGGVELYRSSVHGRKLLEERNLAAPACSDCHGSHGAAPPRVQEVEAVCGHCHSTVQEAFEQSPHVLAASAQTTVQCATCHSHHAIQPASVDLFQGEGEGHCTACHSDDDGARVAADLHGSLRQLEQTLGDAERKVSEAGTRGLFLGDARDYLEDARSLLLRARARSHTLSTDAMHDVLNRGLGAVQTTLESLELQRRGYRDRRILTGILFAVSLAFALALWLYSREIRGPLRHAGRGREARGGS
jgi:hypothetical protein